ncbi:MAG: site-specific integrase [Acidimicrobiales bacterium]
MGRRHYGTVRKLPSGRWQARYTDRAGRQISAPVTFANKGDATAWLSTAQTDQSRGEFIDPKAGRVKLSDYAEVFLAGRLLAPTTVDTYRGLLDLHILPALGDHEIGDLTPSTIRWWRAGLAKRHASTAAKAYRLLRTILNMAVDDELIARNPCRVEGGGKEPADERPIATMEEVDAIAEAIHPRFKALVLLAAWCQLRKGELCGLRRRDIDLVKAKVTVRQSLQQLKDGRILVKDPKTESSRRTVTIPSHILPALTSHVDSYAVEGPDGLVFTGVRGGPIRPHVLQKHWEIARAAAGRPDLHFHDLRHTGNTWAASTGASTKELMARMGHSTPDAAIRYQHATESRDQAIADALAAFSHTAQVIPLPGIEEG